MKNANFAGIAGGFLGGLLGAFALAQLSAAPPAQNVVTASRVQLADGGSWTST